MNLYAVEIVHIASGEVICEDRVTAASANEARLWAMQMRDKAHYYAGYAHIEE